MNFNLLQESTEEDFGYVSLSCKKKNKILKQ